jgi:formate dehydrogenase major subunit
MRGGRFDSKASILRRAGRWLKGRKTRWGRGSKGNERCSIHLAGVRYSEEAINPDGGTFTNTDRRVQLGRKALVPPGDARQDWWIVQKIACRMGLGWNYTHPREIFAEMRSCMPSIRGISWERLEREDAVTYPCDAEDEPGQEVIFGDGFPTPTGRGRFIPAAVLPPHEVPDGAYPMVLTTGRLLEHWHAGAMTRRASALDDLEPEAMVHLSPRDLERLGVRPGDPVRVQTRRGAIELKCRSDRDVPPGLVFIPFRYAEAAANLLTNPALDPFAKIPEFKFCAARVEKSALQIQVGQASR